MKIKLVICFVILTTAGVWSLNLENKGTYKLTKPAENNVTEQWVLKDANDVNVPVWEKEYGIDMANELLTAAQAQVKFYDMNDADAIQYVASKKMVAEAFVVRWQVIVDKFAGPIDTE